MKIYEWTRIENLPLNIGAEFSYIREEAELLGNVDSYYVHEMVEEIFYRDFPQFFKDLKYDQVIEVEYYLFESFESDGVSDEDSNFPGYAVYIHFHRDLVEKLYNHVLDKHPDYVLAYLNYMEY